jgi:FkbM family methyltransferase
MLKKALTKFSRRPFPRNLHALRSCRISYAQFGEDLFLTSLLGYEKTDGVYVDVGCYHPIDYSNTYIFYQRGWHGIAIDPNPHWKAEWQKFRPRDKFINAAVAASVGSMIYLMNRRYPACNRLLPEAPRKTSSDESLITVPTSPLTDLLDKHMPSTRIDLLNIDCEGHDLEVLRTFDFIHRKPLVIAAEDSTVRTDSPLSAFLETQGYDCMSHIGLTKIFRFKETGT